MSAAFFFLNLNSVFRNPRRKVVSGQFACLPERVDSFVAANVAVPKK
jgi:hypothetical protein